MRLHRFFINKEIQERGEVIVADKVLLHQWKKVFRFGEGDRVILFDGSGFDYICQFVLLTKAKGVLNIVEARKNEFAPKKEIHLFQSVIKKDNFEWVLEKGTELGVSYFHPIISERSEKKNINFERAEKIIIEASEQSGRGKLAEIQEVSDLESCLDNNFPSVVFHLDGEEFKKEDFANEKIMGVFIGPEGGWSDREINLFKEKGVKILSLGMQTLKAETAAIAVSALLLL